MSIDLALRAAYWQWFLPCPFLAIGGGFILFQPIRNRANRRAKIQDLNMEHRRHKAATTVAIVIACRRV